VQTSSLCFRVSAGGLLPVLEFISFRSAQLRFTLQGQLPPMLLQEEANLCEQGFRVEGLDDVVDRPVGIALDDLFFLTVDGGHKNDRRVTSSRPFPDQCGRGETVEVGHLHVEEDQRAFVVQQEPERFPPRRCLDQALSQGFEGGLEGDEVRGAIIDEQDGGGRVVHRGILQPRAVQRLAIP
jgi:hypothetical protein